MPLASAQTEIRLSMPDMVAGLRPRECEQQSTPQTWTALQHGGPDHPGVLVDQRRGPGRSSGRRSGPPAGAPRPTAATPMENPYCSCKLTRLLRRQARSVRAGRGGRRAAGGGGGGRGGRGGAAVLRVPAGGVPRAGRCAGVHAGAGEIYLFRPRSKYGLSSNMTALITSGCGRERVGCRLSVSLPWAFTAFQCTCVFGAFHALPCVCNAFQRLFLCVSLPFTVNQLSNHRVDQPPSLNRPRSSKGWGWRPGWP